MTCGTFSVCVYIYVSMFYFLLDTFFLCQIPTPSPKNVFQDRCLALLYDFPPGENENFSDGHVLLGAAALAFSSAMRWTEALTMAAAAPNVVTALLVPWMHGEENNEKLWRNMEVFYKISDVNKIV